MAKVTPTPRGWHTLTPTMTVRNAAAAIDFYKRVFGAEELTRMNTPEGKVAHAELKIGDSILMLGDEFPNSNAQSPETLGGNTGGIMLYVPDVDAVFDRAIQAGAQSRQAVADMFWGDRYGNFIDPFGQAWAVATHKEDLSSQEIDRRAKEFFAKMKVA